MIFSVAILCVVSVTASLAVQVQAQNSDAVTSLLLTISERLEDLDQRLSDTEDRLTLRLDTIDSYFDDKGVPSRNRTCTRGGTLAIEPFPERTNSTFKAADVCAKNYGSRLAEIRSHSDLDYVRNYLKFTLGDVRTGGTTEIRLGLRTSVGEHGLLNLDQVSQIPKFRGQHCIVVSDHVIPSQDRSHRIWRLYSKLCSLKSTGGVLCYF